MTFDSVLLNGILVALMYEQIAHVAVTQRRERRDVPIEIHQIGHGDRADLQHFRADLRGRIAERPRGRCVQNIIRTKCIL